MKKRTKRKIRKYIFILLLLHVLNVFFSPVRLGLSSWYSRHSPGINYRTANNEVFDDTQMTCAMWGMPFNTRVVVINLLNGKMVWVRVNDRGPHPRYVLTGRVIDLTEAAFARLSNPHRGLAFVWVIRVF